jgi:L-rhamnose mutarotase
LEIKRIGSVIGVKPDQIAEYERIHAEVWPGVLATLKRANVTKFSIFRHENMLFLIWSTAAQIMKPTWQ